MALVSNLSLSFSDLVPVTSEENPKIHWHILLPLPINKEDVQRVPALRVFWDLEKSVLHETRVSGTVL